MSTNYTYLMAAVGSALHAWSQVESGMGQFFRNVSGIPDMHKSDAIFDAVISFETRIAVLDAAIAFETNLSDEEKRIWTSLSARLRKLYKKRHEVAHFGLADASDMVNGTRIAPFFSWGKHQKDQNKYLTQTQILERAGLFTEASKAVGWFTYRTFRPAPRQVVRLQPLEEPPLIVHIRELLAQRQEEQSRQPEA